MSEMRRYTLMTEALEIIKLAAVSSGLVLNTVRDIRTGRIHVKATLFMLFAGIAYFAAGAVFYYTDAAIPETHPAQTGIAGALLPLLPGIALFIISKLTYEAIGKGDVYLILILGLFHTVGAVLAIVFAAFVAAGIYAAILLTFVKKNGYCCFPFVPFLSAAWEAYAIFSVVRWL